jgi:hypothetical protein
MLQAILPPVLRTDNDDLHIAEHSGLAANPSTRRNSLVTLIIMAHIEAHEANRVTKAQKQLLDQMAVQSVVPVPVMPQGQLAQQQGPSQPPPQASAPQKISGQSGMPQPSAS